MGLVSPARPRRVELDCFAVNGATTATNQILFGSNARFYETLHLGRGINAATAAPFTLQNSNRTGTNAAQGGLVVQPGSSTGNAAPAPLTFNSGLTGSTGTTAQSYGQAIRISGDQNVELGAPSIATTATDGFPYMPAAAGPPTGTPTAKTGFVPFYYDTTNEDFYIYNGAWVSVTLA